MCVYVCVSHHLLPSRQPGPRPWVPPAGMPCSRHPPARPLDGGQLEPPSPCHLPLLHCTPRSQGHGLAHPSLQLWPAYRERILRLAKWLFAGQEGDGFGQAETCRLGDPTRVWMRPLTARGRAESGNKVGVGGISILAPRPCRWWSWTRWFHPIRTLARRHFHKWKKKKKTSCFIGYSK